MNKLFRLMSLSLLTCAVNTFGSYDVQMSIEGNHDDGHLVPVAGRLNQPALKSGLGVAVDSSGSVHLPVFQTRTPVLEWGAKYAVVDDSTVRVPTASGGMGFTCYVDPGAPDYVEGIGSFTGIYASNPTLYPDSNFYISGAVNGVCPSSEAIKIDEYLEPLPGNTIGVPFSLPWSDKICVTPVFENLSSPAEKIISSDVYSIEYTCWDNGGDTECACS